MELRMVLKYTSLKQKDLDYLTFILRNGIVTAKQIRVKFEEPTLTRVYSRVRKLMAKGLVKYERIAPKVGVYFGSREARDVTNTDVTVPSKATIYTIQHALLMNDLLLFHEFLFEKEGIEFQYQTEREIRFKALGQGSQPNRLQEYNQIRDRIPDAIFVIKKRDGTPIHVWVELELNKKDHRRYDEKFKLFDDLLLNGHFDQIRYFTNLVQIKNAVNKAKRKLVNDSKVVVRDIPEEILNDRWEEVKSSGKN
ncbi:hypothetical protein ACJROX_26840 [Pseudalkalibacillus sp. A8]|uniref:hypothetical protein n=1 Tax=Pseudalkalibacillus sp. A8 TaxID=3382641 RepID=UPI0038B57D94